jgi:hypothetical protein
MDTNILEEPSHSGQKTCAEDEVSRYSETLLLMYHTTWHHIPEGHNPTANYFLLRNVEYSSFGRFSF